MWCKWKPEYEMRVEVNVTVKIKTRMKIMIVIEDYISRVYSKNNRSFILKKLSIKEKNKDI